MTTKTANIQPENTSAYILMDVLPREHYEQIHLPGAVNACVYDVTFIDQVRTLSHDPAAPLLLYGDSTASNEASYAAEKLTRAGYRDLTILRGGLKAWREAGYPLEGCDLSEGMPQPDNRLANGSYTLDTAASHIVWSGRNPNGKHWGTLTLHRGELVVVNGNVKGHFDIDLFSLTSIDLEDNPLRKVLIKHLLSDDFLYAERYPHATYTLLNAHPIPAAASTQPNYHLRGELQLRGLTAPLDFAATVTRNTRRQWLAEAHFDLDRTRWEMVYGSSRFFAHLGKHAVFDLISLEITLQIDAR